MGRTSFSEYVTRARQVHGQRYDYLESSYTVMNAKLVIVCKRHGEFQVWAVHHLNGSGCKRCRFNVTRFLSKAREKHGDRFTYPEPIEPINGKIKVECAIHGVFEQRPNAHLAGSSCNSCAKDSKALTYDPLRKALESNRDRLQVSEEAFNQRTSLFVTAVCRIHGEQTKRITDLLTGSGCQECYFDSKRQSIESMEKEAREAWGETYSYDWEAHKLNRKLIYPICKKHGRFATRKGHHFDGFGGCPKCRRCSYGELAVGSWLDEKGVGYQREWTHDTLRSPRGFKLKVDFSILSSQLLIEYDGPQHFEPWVFGSRTKEKELKAKENLIRTQEHDRIKDRWAEANGYRLIRLTKADLFRRLEEEVLPILYFK